jgi:carboxylesterase type B
VFTAGLFQRVILESGPVLSLAHHLASLEKGEQFGDAVARSLGAPGTLQKLREAPREKVVAAASEVAVRADNPVNPGYVLAADPGRGPRDGVIELFIKYCWSLW